MFECSITGCINADPSVPSLFTAELGNKSGEWHGENNIQSESSFLLACDEFNVEREVGHEIMVCETKDLLLTETSSKDVDFF